MSTGKLVEYLSSPLVDLQDMERMLDPTGEDRCVDQQLKEEKESRSEERICGTSSDV